MNDYSAILTGEAGQAGILAAVQGRGARRALCARLDAMLTPGCRAGRLALERVKYKPGRRLLGHFTAQVGDQARLRTVPVVVTWSIGSGGADSGGAEDDGEVRQIEEEAGRRGLLAPFTRLQSETAELGNGAAVTALLQVWPLDPEFPHLSRLGDPTYTNTLFQSAGVTLPSDCIKIQPIRYRPGERHVLRFQVETAGEPQILYAKLYRSAQAAARAARIANRVSDWLEANLMDFHGVRPAGVCLEDRAILYPHAYGRPLSQHLRRSPEWLGRQIRLVGEALRTLQRGPLSLADELEANPFDKEVQVVRRASEHVQVLLPETGQRILKLLDRIEEQHARLPQEALAFTHSDFKSDHLLVSRDGIALIDFDTCALADPALDVGKFLADLDWWHAITHTTGVEHAQQAFLDGYGEVDVDGRMARARIYRALILTKIAIRRARLYWKDWPTVTNQMVQKAESIAR